MNILFILVFIILFIFTIINSKEHYITYNNIEYSNNLNIENIKDLHNGQKIMTNMLKEFHDLCENNDIKYWCLGGTLIGALRHKGWIPWDGDIDLGMLQEDYDKFKNLANLLPKHMNLSEPNDKPCRKIRTNKAKYIFTKWGNNWDQDKGLQIDIFIYNINKKENQIYGNSPVCGIPDKNKREKTDIFPLKKMKFENIYVYVPNKYEKISKELWKNYPPKLIPINKRYPHEGNIKTN